MGGRVATFRKGNYVADLGAMVVTGLGKSYLENVCEFNFHSHILVQNITFRFGIVFFFHTELEVDSFYLPLSLFFLLSLVT